MNEAKLDSLRNRFTEDANYDITNTWDEDKVVSTIKEHKWLDSPNQKDINELGRDVAEEEMYKFVRTFVKNHHSPKVTDILDLACYIYDHTNIYNEVAYKRGLITRAEIPEHIIMTLGNTIEGHLSLASW